jgi:hypothetical protein
MWVLPSELQLQYSRLEAALAAAETPPGGTPQPTPQTKLAVTEWGPLFSVGGQSWFPGFQFYDFTKTMGSAIYVASQLETFLRDPNIVIANYFGFSSGTPMGLIADPYAANCWYGNGNPILGIVPAGCAGGPGPTSKARLIDGTTENNSTPSSNDDFYMEKPSGYVFQLFHQAFGTQLVTTTSPNTPASDPSLFFNFPQGAGSQGTLVSTRSPNFMMMPWDCIDTAVCNTSLPADFFPKLDVVSSLSADGSKLYVMVVNKSLSTDAPITTTINLSGFAPQSQAIVSTLGSSNATPSLDDNNGVDVDLSWLKFNPKGQPLVGTKANTVSITTSQIGNASSSFTYTFASGTITSIQLIRAQ